MMTINQLECFRAVARRRHFAKGAAALGKTQPALSVQIQRLEEALGITLLERTGRQVILTPAGEILLPYAEKVLSDVEEAQVKMAEVKGGDLGLIRVGVIPTVAAHFLPSVIAEFKARFPKVTVLLREEGRTPQLVTLLNNNEIDISLGLELVKPNGLRSLKLLTEEICIGVSAQHPFASHASLPLNKFRKEKFILYKTTAHNMREITLKSCRNAGFEPEVAFESEQAETIQNMVASNLGVTMLPHMVLRDNQGERIRMIRIEAPTPRRTIVATWRAGRYLSLNSRQFLQCAEIAARRVTPASPQKAAR
jgi:DNA-binding transcriptional LysR family regulator